MISLIPYTLMAFLDKHASQEVIATIKADAGLPADYKFRLDKSYPDQDWQKLFNSTIKHTGLSENDIYEKFATFFLEFAIEEFGTWFKTAKNSYELLKKQPQIHNTLYQGITGNEEHTDKFRIEAKANEITTYYNSPNKLCGLYKALAHEVLKYYGDAAEILENKCMHQGDPYCEIQIKWTKLAS